jgi:hypothetical protein
VGHQLLNFARKNNSLSLLLKLPETFVHGSALAVRRSVDRWSDLRLRQALSQTLSHLLDAVKQFHDGDAVIARPALPLKPVFDFCDDRRPVFALLTY